MEFNWFTRAIARVVLASYVTQVFAPVVYAMEVERHSGGFGVGQPGLRDPSPPREKILQNSFQQSLGFKPRVETLKPSLNIADIELNEDKARLQAEAYQYRLRVKNVDLATERFQLKLSRKEKGSEGSFERLHTASIRQGKLTSIYSKALETQDDMLLNLFKGAAVHRFTTHNNTICFAWEIGDSATLKIGRDGSVFFDQGSVPLLSAYDLVLKTSGELFLESLGVEKLTLQSPKTQIIGSVVADHLHMDHTITNEGGMQVKQLTGQGTLTNHAILKLEGTAENPAILGVSKVLNEKNKAIDKEAKIESPHLRITSDNEFFLNAKGSELRVSGTIIASPLKNHAANTQPRPSFINKGEISLGEGAIIRDIINSGEWKAHQLWVLGKKFTNTKDATLKVFKNFGTSAFLLNEGEIDAKLINMENGTNTGRIKGDGLHLTVWQKMVNNGIANLQHITGKGSFINQGSLKIQGTEEKPTYIGINRFVNQKHEDSSYAPKVEGKYIKALARNDYADQEPQSLKIQGLHIQNHTCNSNPNFNFFSNRSFHNAAQAEIDVYTLVVAGSSACSNISCGALFTNEGEIRTKIGEICRDETRNLGNLTADKLVIKATSFTNDRLANIKVFDELSLNILNKSCRNLEGALLNKGNIEGKKIRIAAKEHTFRLLPNDMDSASTVARMFENYWEGLLGVYLKEGTLVCKTHKKEEIAILKNNYGPTSSRGIPADVFSRVEEATRRQEDPSLEDKNEILKFALLRGYTPISSLELCNNGQIKAKSLEVHNPIANSGEIIAKKVHGLGRMVNFLEGKVHATHLLDLASVSNKGKISGHKLNLKTKEFLMNLSSGEVQAKSLRTGSTLTNKGKIFGERLTTGKLVNFGETEARDISLWEGQNTGTLIGSKLNVGNEMISSGQVILNELSGETFTNQNSLKMAPIEDRPAHISIRNFYNESTQTTVAKVLGNKVTVTGTNKAFINKADSELLVNHLVFSMPETGSFLPLMGFNSETSESCVKENCRRFSNLGTVKTDVLDVTRDYMANFGKIETLEFKVRGYLFENICWALGNNFMALLHVGQSIKAETSIFNNYGEIFVDNGSFTQESGTFNNDGLWNHQGDINLGTTSLHNKGEIRWQKGSWRCEEQKPEDPTQLSNQGTWALDQIRGSRIPRMHNTGLLSLNNGAVEFDAVINEANIILSGGQHKIGYFYNYHLLSFLDQDWFYSDDFITSLTMPNSLQVGIYDGPGEVEAEKALTYDVQVLPKLIRSNGDVSFSKRYSQGRTLADLEKVNALGKVSFYTPAITTTQDYEFGNIGHLALYVDGLFTTRHFFKAPALTLEANGPLTCGASNTVMGTIAATGEPLRVTAHSADCRFGKMYGAGPMRIKSTRGDILVGAAKPETASEDYGESYTRNGKNGAFFASGSTLCIKSSHDILVDYGQTISTGTQNLKTSNLLRNTAGEISSTSDISVAAREYLHRRDGKTVVSKNVSSGWDCVGARCYHDVTLEYPLSGPAVIQALGNICLKVNKFTNAASNVFSGGNTFLDGKKLLDSPSYKEEICYFGKTDIYRSDYADVWEGSRKACYPGTRDERYQPNLWSFGPKTNTGKELRINMGDFVITGNMNAPVIAIQATGEGLFHNTNRTRQTITPTDTLFIDLTQFIQREARGNGFLQLTSDGEVKTEFHFGKPHSPDLKQMMMLGNGQDQTFPQVPFNPANTFNPLRNLSSGILNLSIQSALSELAGKVYEQGGRGKGLLKTLEHNTAVYRHKTNKEIVTRDDLKDASAAMLLYGLQQVGNIIQQQTFLCLPPSEINPYQSSGDISGDEITIETQGDQTHLNNRIVARDILNAASTKGKLIRETQSYTVIHETRECKITQQVAMPQQQFICERGDVNAFAHKDMTSIGVLTQAGRDILETAETGNIKKAPLILQRTVESNTEEDDGWFSTNTVSETNTSHMISPTTTVAGRNVIESAGEGIHLSGAKEIAGEDLIYNGPSLTTEAAMVNNTHSKTSTTSGMFSKRTDSISFSTVSADPTELNAKRIILNPDFADFKGTDFVALILEDNTKEGAKLGPSIGVSHYSQRSVNESALARSDVGCEGWYEVMQPCRLMVKEVIRNLPEGEMKLNSVVWDKNKTEIIGKFAETTYDLKKWHTEWAIHEQLIPTEALVVVALAVGFATQGWGASLISKLSSTMFGTVNVAATATTAATIAPAIKLSALGVAVANAGVSAVCSRIVTAGLQTGDLSQVAKDLTSVDFVRSLGISMLSAGLCQHIGAALKIDMNPSLKEVLTEGKIKPVFTDFLQTQALKSAVNTGLNVAVGGQPGSESLATAARDVALNSVAAWASYKVGDAGFQGKMTPEQQDLTHTGIGALFGVATHLDKPLEGAITGGLNAFAAARASKIMFGSREEIKIQAEEELRQQGRPVTDENLEMAMNDLLHQKTAISTLLSALATAAITRDPGLTSTGIFTATNVVENNCIPSMTKSVLYSEGFKYPEKDIKEGFWQDEYTDPDDLYLDMASAPGENNQHYAMRNHISEGIESIQEALEDKNLSTWQRIALTKELHTMLELQAEMKVTHSAIRYMVTPVKTLVDSKERKLTEINHWVESSHNMLMDTTIPVWQRMGCGPLQESLLNDWEIVRQWPETKLDAGLLMLNASPLVAPVITVSGQVVRMFERNIGSIAQRVGLRYAQPIPIYSGAVRPAQFGISPIHDFSVGHISIPANQNMAMSFNHFERSPAVRKVLADFDQRRGFFTPIKRAQLRLVDGKQTTSSLPLVNSRVVDKTNVLGRPFEAKDFVTTRSKLFGTEQVYTFKADRVRPISGRGPINADYAGRVYDFSPTNLAKKIEGIKDQVKIEEITKKYAELHNKYPHGVPFTGTGHPDFARYAVKKVEIKVTGDHQIDFALANKASGLKSTPKDLTWHHHEGGKIMQLVPKDLHNTIRHTGGVAVVKGNL